MRWTLQELFGNGPFDPVFTYECNACGSIVRPLETHLNWHNDVIKDWQVYKPVPLEDN